jgi:hypothetical protein
VDTINDALIACVKACGGSKAVGLKLWPEKPVDAAQRLLLDCLNEDRPQKLAPEQVEFVFRLARDKGCHVGIEYLAHALSYTVPAPVEPRDELAELERRFIGATEDLTQMLKRIEHLRRPGPRAVGA